MLESRSDQGTAINIVMLIENETVVASDQIEKASQSYGSEAAVELVWVEELHGEGLPPASRAAICAAE